jgi:low temperature requirement protein LtrA
LCWCTFAWTTNTTRIDQGVMPVVLFTVAAAVLVVGVTSAEAFGDQRGGFYGPLVFPVCYLVVRVLSMGTLWYSVRDNSQRRRTVLRFATPVPIAVTLLVLAAATPALFGTSHDTAIRMTFWTLAVIVEYGASITFRLHDWRDLSAGHWADRFALILIIAIGESIISIGGSGEALERPITWPALGAVLAGIAISASLWWYYFDFLARAAELALRHTQGSQRVQLARAAYPYLHLPMIAGVILFSLGVRQILQHLYEIDAPSTVRAFDRAVMFGGVILYLMGQIGFQLRMLGTVTWTRVGTVVLLAILCPIGGWVPAPWPLVMMAVVCVGLVLVENLILSSSRRVLREANLEEAVVQENREAAWHRRHR